MPKIWKLNIKTNLKIITLLLTNLTISEEDQKLFEAESGTYYEDDINFYNFIETTSVSLQYPGHTLFRGIFYYPKQFRSISLTTLRS